MKRIAESITRKTLPYVAALAAGSSALAACGPQDNPNKDPRPVREEEVANFAELYGAAIDKIKVTGQEKKIVRAQSGATGQGGDGAPSGAGEDLSQPKPPAPQEGKGEGVNKGDSGGSKQGGEGGMASGDKAENGPSGGGSHGPNKSNSDGALKGGGAQPGPSGSHSEQYRYTGELETTHKTIPASDGKSGYDLSVTRKVNEDSELPGDVTAVTISSYIKDGDAFETVYSGSLSDEEAKQGGIASDSWSASVLYSPFGDQGEKSSADDSSIALFYSEGAETTHVNPPELTTSELGVLTRDMARVLFDAEDRKPVESIDPPRSVAEQLP